MYTYMYTYYTYILYSTYNMYVYTYILYYVCVYTYYIMYVCDCGRCWDEGSHKRPTTLEIKSKMERLVKVSL